MAESIDFTEEQIFALAHEFKPSTAHTAQDSLVLKNQVVAKEGILPYPAGNKLKRWEDLAKNIGRKIPVLDEHPDFNNGNFGLFSGKEKVYGWATLKQCPGGQNRLCADIELEDSAPKKRGYSIGYPFEELNIQGDYEGQPYVSIQRILFIDHLALTDIPRDPVALRRAMATAGDSKNGKHWETGRANKYWIGYDQINLANIPLDPKSEVGIDHSTTGDNKMGELEERIMKENAELKAKLAKLEALKTANDSYEEKVKGLESKIKELESEVSNLKTENDSLKKAQEEAIRKKAESQAKELVEKYGFDAKELEGKDPKWVDAAYTAAKKIGADALSGGAKIIKKNPQGQEEVGQDADENLTGVVYKWDPEQGKSVPLGRFVHS